MLYLQYFLLKKKKKNYHATITIVERITSNEPTNISLEFKRRLRNVSVEFRKNYVNRLARGFVCKRIVYSLSLR